MEFTYTFEGINAKDGQYPRAVVVAQFPLDDVPRDLANLTVKISLPINDLDSPVSAVAQRAIAAARSLLNESVAVQWIQEQPVGRTHQLAEPADAVTLRFGSFEPNLD